MFHAFHLQFFAVTPMGFPEELDGVLEKVNIKMNFFREKE
jgi:hypothetical protein